MLERLGRQRGRFECVKSQITRHFSLLFAVEAAK